MKFLKENIKMIVFLSIIIVLFPVVILIASSKGFIPHDTGLAIIGYGGVIIGGLLTLYGVTMTINYEKKERQSNGKKQMEILDKQEFPFPLFELSYIPNNDTEGKKEKLKLLNLDDGDLLVSTIPRQCKAEINLNFPINKKYENQLSIAEKVNIYIEFEYNNKHMFPHKQEIMIDCFCMINDELTDNAKTIWHPEKFNSSIKIKNIT